MIAIIGLLELEREQALQRDEPFAEGLDIAYRSARDLIELIGDSLDLAKIESGSMQLAPVVTPLRPLMDSIRQLFDGRARQSGLELQLLFADEADGDYWLDPLRLRQVLHNLLGNALKFTARGSVVIRVEALESSSDKTLVRISVEDTGAGIPARQQAQLFEPFIQGSGATAARYGGSGLGLSICKQLVGLMDGRIALSSIEGSGTQVRLELPLARSVAQPVRAEPAETSIAAAERRLRLLVVDDLSSSRLVLTRQLEYLGHDVVSVENGEAALQYWRDDSFDGVITDCNMPGMSGYVLAETLRRLERQEHRCPVAIIGCTANATLEEEPRCVQAGMDDLLVKPVSLARLSSLLAQRFKESSFDVGTLRRMTQANEAQMQRLLNELDKNLLEERAVMSAAVARRDLRTLEASLHRLKGAACLINAAPLARICAQLNGRIRSGGQQDLGAHWAALELSIDRLRVDIAQQLAGFAL